MPCILACPWVALCSSHYPVADSVALYDDSMPHCHSAPATAARRQRAIARGFVAPCPQGHRFVAARADIADRARAVSRSLAVHADHCKIAGRPMHSAIAAATAARPTIGKALFEEARDIHKARNRAAHAWADFVPGHRGTAPKMARGPLGATQCSAPEHYRMDEDDENEYEDEYFAQPPLVEAAAAEEAEEEAAERARAEGGAVLSAAGRAKDFEGLKAAIQAAGAAGTAKKEEAAARAAEEADAAGRGAQATPRGNAGTPQRARVTGRGVPLRSIRDFFLARPRGGDPPVASPLRAVRWDPSQREPD